MTAYILDASVAAKWVLPSTDEPLGEEAALLLDRFASGQASLSVPDLFWPEIGNLLWKNVRVGRIPEQSAQRAIDWLCELKVPTVCTQGLVRDALGIALAFDRSAYDALYIALAIASGRPLLTADERLVNAVGARLPVRWLGALA